MTATRVGSLVYGADEIVAEFVRRRIKGAEPDVFGKFPLYKAIGVIRHETLVGGIVYFNFKKAVPSIEVSIAFDTPLWATKAALHAMCDYPFNKLGVVRVTSLVARKNKRARRMNEGVGFKLEGVVRKGFGYDDCCIYGLLRHECRWLKDKTNG